MGQLRLSPSVIGAALAAAIVAVPTATATATVPFTGRTVSCDVPSIALSFSPTKVVVTSGGRVLAQATRTTRSFSNACRRVRNASVVERHNLDPAPGPRGRASCPLAKPTITIAVLPVRNAGGRIIGTRIAVWLNKYVTEIAEGMLTNRPWFLYARTICVPA